MIIICSKQGPKIEGAVLNRVGNLGLFFCPIQSGPQTLSWSSVPPLGTKAPKVRRRCGKGRSKEQNEDIKNQEPTTKK